MAHKNYNKIKVIPSDEDIRKNFTQTFNTNDEITFIYILKYTEKQPLPIDESLVSSQNIEIEFYKLINTSIREKLEVIDSFMPNIISYILLYSLENNIKGIKDILERLYMVNPLSYRRREMYYYKYKELLRAVALGELSSDMDSKSKENLGIYVLKKTNGDILYSQREFDEYLLTKTRLKNLK